MIKKIKLYDIGKIDIILTKNMTDAQVYNKYKPDYLINLALYDMATGTNITYLEDENKQSGYLFSDRGLGITKDGKPIWCTKTDAYKSSDIKDYTSFSPVLVENGKVSINWGNKVSTYVNNGSHIRCFLGMNKDYFFIGVTDVGMSINSLANYCVNQGMTYAGNNDGGGSVSLWENGKALKKSSRKNASWLLIYLKPKQKNTPTTTKKEDDEVVKKIKINIDGKIKEIDAIVKDGRTYVQLRAFESEGYKITYENGIAGIEHPKK